MLAADQSISTNQCPAPVIVLSVGANLRPIVLILPPIAFHCAFIADHFLLLCIYWLPLLPIYLDCAFIGYHSPLYISALVLFAIIIL